LKALMPTLKARRETRLERMAMVRDVLWRWGGSKQKL
jgi:hypothetical protein